MTILNKAIIATTVSFIALGGAAFADGHELNLNAARLDTTLDRNGDGEVTDLEIIDGNMAFFDANGDGAIDAAERGHAEEMIMSGATTIAPMDTSDAMPRPMVEFDAAAARIDLSLDTDGDGEVSIDEIIDGNMAVFDTNNSGAIDAAEQGVAEEMLETGSATIAIDAGGSTAGVNMSAATDFNAQTARLDLTLDVNNDGEVDMDELIDGNVAVFDTDGNGTIDAEERGVAATTLANE
ncbi:MAG: hypothetical protein ACSHW1_20055 [Yoonia sp.]|uniref:hypothetical protein n=1 Tax=Yoonia sp. TaxID=2212373 RepID=UPI003EF114F7